MLDLARGAFVDGASLLNYSSSDQAFSFLNTPSCGLRNVGNTCYLNSVLFAMAGLTPVYSWAEQHLKAHAGNLAANRPCTLCSLALDLRSLNTCSVNVPFVPSVVQTRSFWARGLAGFHQQDAQESLLLLLEQCDAIDTTKLQIISDALRDPAFPNSVLRFTTPCWRLFGALTLVKVTCRVCGQLSMKYEMVRTLSVHIPKPPHETSVNAAVTAHLGREELTDPQDCCENEACGALGRRVKNTELLTWPRVLIIHFKRLGLWNVLAQCAEKDDRHVEFEARLEPSDDIRYQLGAVVVHSGNQVGGHYTTYTRHIDDSWYYCDDSAPPRPATIDEVFACNAYMLWYER